VYVDALRRLFDLDEAAPLPAPVVDATADAAGVADAAGAALPRTASEVCALPAPAVDAAPLAPPAPFISPAQAS
jgi:hypothetical protein